MGDYYVHCTSVTARTPGSVCFFSLHFAVRVVFTCISTDMVIMVSVSNIILPSCCRPLRQKLGFSVLTMAVSIAGRPVCRTISLLRFRFWSRVMQPLTAHSAGSKTLFCPLFCVAGKWREVGEWGEGGMIFIINQ